MTDKNYLSFMFLYTIMVLLCVTNVSVNSQNSPSLSNDIPVTNPEEKNNLGPTLKILYCYSCGYRKVFEQYAAMLHQKYPEISVEGDLYPPSDYNIMLARTLGSVKLLLIMCVLGSINIFSWLGQQAPSWWIWCTTNKLYSCVMIFFLCNAIEGQLMSTGAFEISLNDKPVWSKLETGKIPQPPELFKILENHMHTAA